MSKKRIWSLSSKWKLSKELGDYKKHKKDKKQGGAGYSDEPIVKVPAKKKFPCKKLKGEHDFKLADVKKYYYFAAIADIYECTACGKIKYVFKDN